ncbi:nicotinate phosphoribosyltransferase [Piedraia hortae CBS 480.64]|uniref:Nicotinate phosphoribosyltransferase n=1 Tax=Piedraia hortae CBS 480.64 TaxID=1314780 RepID=A0A6A7BU59_9PEZI|nr:nicotinate phosphoribosyltransferase [Piedraia hortae CBS 480.64]
MAAFNDEGIFSILDTDLYKLTMQYAVRKFYPAVPVTYDFTNRTPHMRLNRTAFSWLEEKIAGFEELKLTIEEAEWLRKTCPYLDEEYVTYLQGYRFKPAEHVTVTFDGGEGPEDSGDMHLKITGPWVETILYETPLLALISEAYFKFMEKNWSYEGQRQKAFEKGVRLIEGGCAFSEFGTRRRRSFKTHELVMQGLCKAQLSAKEGSRGKLSGTSNVYLAMKHGVAPVGTVAHEWFMGIAAIEDNYADANEIALRSWTQTFGRGVLGIALTDTFGTETFFRSFTRPADHLRNEDGSVPTYAEAFAGVRQDSGDPEVFIQRIKNFYEKEGLKGKIVVFSDSLNVDKAIRYKKCCEAAGDGLLIPSFGIGTYLTNDFTYREGEQSRRSPPLNIVIKLSHANGRPAVKLSDDLGKNSGDDELIERIKKEVGYEGRAWNDEGHRWD